MDTSGRITNYHHFIISYYTTNIKHMNSGVNASSKLGGVGERRRVWGGGVPLPPGDGSGDGQIFLHCDLEVTYFGEFGGAKFKVFLHRELPQWGSGRFCGKFWISSKAMNKRHH